MSTRSNQKPHEKSSGARKHGVSATQGVENAAKTPLKESNKLQNTPDNSSYPLARQVGALKISGRSNVSTAILNSSHALSKLSGPGISNSSHSKRRQNDRRTRPASSLPQPGTSQNKPTAEVSSEITEKDVKVGAESGVFGRAAPDFYEHSSALSSFEIDIGGLESTTERHLKLLNELMA